MVDVYAKGLAKERVSVSFSPLSLHITIRDTEGQVRGPGCLRAAAAATAGRQGVQ